MCKEKAREFLQAIVDGDLSVVCDEACGVCKNIHEYCEWKFNGYGFVGSNCDDWDRFSGDHCYPVMRNYNFGLWEGSNLEMRQSLCAHLLTKLEDW